MSKFTHARAGLQIQEPWYFVFMSAWWTLMAFQNLFHMFMRNDFQGEALRKSKPEWKLFPSYVFAAMRYVKTCNRVLRRVWLKTRFCQKQQVKFLTFSYSNLFIHHLYHQILRWSCALLSAVYVVCQSSLRANPSGSDWFFTADSDSINIWLLDMKLTTKWAKKTLY